MESRHSGNQTSNGKNMEKYGIGIPWHSDFNVSPIWLQGALGIWFLFHFFPIVPVRPRSSHFFPIFGSISFPFLVPFFHFFLIFFPNASGNLCFFQDGGPHGRGPNHTRTQWKKNEKKTKFRMLVQGGPFLNLSPLMPWPWQFLFVCIWFIFDFFSMFGFVFFGCFSIPWVGPGLLFWFLVPLCFHFFSIFIVRGFHRVIRRGAILILGF